MLAARVGPGHRRPIYLAGCSNDSRLGYRIGCTDRGLCYAIAVVQAMSSAVPVAVAQIGVFRQ